MQTALITPELLAARDALLTVALSMPRAGEPGFVEALEQWGPTWVSALDTLCDLVYRQDRDL